MSNYILVTSVSRALRGKELLDRNNIPSSVERTPRNNIVKSCGYSLLVFGNIDTAQYILRQNNIRILGILPRRL
ncbi:MAG: DUF3343 domain-containing protein [Ruminococcus sp.]|nr:DUF3343 domain-containing protein [Ruminococcus sp.]